MMNLVAMGLLSVITIWYEVIGGELLYQSFIKIFISTHLYILHTHHVYYVYVLNVWYKCKYLFLNIKAKSIIC